MARLISGFLLDDDGALMTTSEVEGAKLVAGFLRVPAEDGSAYGPVVTSGGGGGDAVVSVNGQTGVVVLSALDVGSLPVAETATKSELSSGIASRAPAVHQHVAADVSDSSPVGRAVLMASDAAAARSAIGAGTSSYSGSDAVKVSGAQTVGGVKTFSASPVVPEPTSASQVATKKYVDDNSGGGGGGLDLARSFSVYRAAFSDVPDGQVIDNWSDSLGGVSVGWHDPGFDLASGVFSADSAIGDVWRFDWSLGIASTNGGTRLFVKQGAGAWTGLTINNTLATNRTGVALVRASTADGLAVRLQIGGGAVGVQAGSQFSGCILGSRL